MAVVSPSSTISYLYFLSLSFVYASNIREIEYDLFLDGFYP